MWPVITPRLTDGAFVCGSPSERFAKGSPNRAGFADLAGPQLVVVPLCLCKSSQASVRFAHVRHACGVRRCSPPTPTSRIRFTLDQGQSPSAVAGLNNVEPDLVHQLLEDHGSVHVYPLVSFLSNGRCFWVVRARSGGHLTTPNLQTYAERSNGFPRETGRLSAASADGCEA